MIWKRARLLGASSMRTTLNQLPENTDTKTSRIMHFVIKLYEILFKLTPLPLCFSEPERPLSFDGNVVPSFDDCESATDGMDFTLLREPVGAMKVEYKTLPYQELSRNC